MPTRPSPFAFLSFTLLSVANVACQQPIVDPILDHDTFTVASEATAEERRINVYMPPSYTADEETKFPVLYMPDGGIKEDFPHITNTIDALIRDGAIDPMIVVGIENTERRRDLTGPTTVEKDREVAPVVGGSVAFRTFIRDELIPEIEKRYRCTDRRAIVGESLAGLFVAETFLLEPKLFDVYIAISPSLWWNGHDLTTRAPELLRSQEGMRNTLYLTSADETDIYIYTDQLAKTLEEHSPDGLTWLYEPRRDLHHHTIFRAVSPTAFRKVLAPKKRDE